MFKQDGRLPPAYFLPSHFCKQAFQKDENVFFLEKHSFYIIYSNVSKFKIFKIFCQKNFIVKAEKVF